MQSASYTQRISPQIRERKQKNIKQIIQFLPNTPSTTNKLEINEHTPIQKAERRSGRRYPTNISIDENTIEHTTNRHHLAFQNRLHNPLP
jgi:hypothetical protein